MLSVMDHERIRREQDRAYTLALAGLVVGSHPESPGWDEAQLTLRHLEDDRAIAPLRAFVEDRSQPLAKRQELVRTLTSFDMTTAAPQRLAWWDTGDPALQLYALLTMERSEAPIVSAVAADDLHPLRKAAMSVLEWGFEEPEFQLLKVDGLRSTRPEVRTAAAYALQYFPSLATLDALRQADGRIHPDAEAQRAESLDFMMGSIASQLNDCRPDVRSSLRRWVEQLGATDLADQADEPHDPVPPRAPQRDLPRRSDRAPR